MEVDHKRDALTQRTPGQKPQNTPNHSLPKKDTSDTESQSSSDLSSAFSNLSSTSSRDAVYRDSNIDSIISELRKTDASNFDNKEQLLFDLAKAGFSKIDNEESDNLVRCNHCKMEFKLNSKYVNMRAYHIVSSPNCSFVKEMCKKPKLAKNEREHKHYAAFGESNSAEGNCDSGSSGSSSGSSSSSSSACKSSDETSQIPKLVTKRLNVNDSGEDVGTNMEVLNDEEKYEMYKKLCLRFENESLEEVRAICSANRTVTKDVFDECYRQSTFEEFQGCSSKVTKLYAFRGLYLHLSKKRKEIRCGFCTFKRVFTEEMVTSPETASAIHNDHLKNNCCHLSGWSNSNNKPDIFNLVGYEYGRVADASSLLLEESADSDDQLGISYRMAKHTSMAVEDRRISTFLTYPYKASKHKEPLSASGYFYEGEGDRVTCFSCGIQSSDWTSSCNVWLRHARSSSSCPFVILQKGQSFIDNALAEYGPYQTKKPEDKITNVTTRMLRPRMDSQPVQKALDMGLNREAVRTVVGNRIKRGDSDFKYVAEIVRAVNDLAIPESQLPGSEPTHLSLPQVIKPPEDPTIVTEERPKTTEKVDNTEEVDSLQVDAQVPSHTGKKDSEDRMEIADVFAKSHQIRSQLTCKICMTDIVSIIFLPCGHLACCSTCSAAMTSCPLCRKEVKGTVKVNF